eukprot:Hpha_TRINITY_DN18615_c0_g1::TRINITY_DN18615_c0_g1_i1::g.115748::m.115748
MTLEPQGEGLVGGAHGGPAARGSYWGFWSDRGTMDPTTALPVHDRAPHAVARFGWLNWGLLQFSREEAVDQIGVVPLIPANAPLQTGGPHPPPVQRRVSSRAGGLQR